MYTEYYGLTRKPFENTPDPAFLFLSKCHREVLASLLYGVNEGKGFTVVVGDVGTGKTTLIHALLQGLRSQNLILHLINQRYEFNEILHNLAKTLSLDIKGKTDTEITEAVREKLDALDKSGKRAVIIIDEAHHLTEDSLEEIRLISNIETEKRKLIQIVLAGQIELYRKLNRDSLRQLKQRIVINRILEPLNKKETMEYIHHRLRLSGRITPLFNRKTLSLIWGKSRGIPRVINHLCDNALVIGFASGERKINHKILKEVINDMEGGKIFLKDSQGPFFIKLKWATVAASMILLTIFLGAYISGKPIYQKNVANKMPALNHISAINAEASSQETIIWADQLRHHLSKPENTFNKDTAKNSERTVKPDEYLVRIAREEYGISNDTIIDLIHMANPSLKNIGLIYANQKITLPQIERKNLIVQDEQGSYYIHYASFYKFEMAQQALQELTDYKQNVFLITALQGDTMVYRLYLGIFSQYKDAENTLKSLNLRYLLFLDDKNFAGKSVLTSNSTSNFSN
ncbi:MAG: AAA family ATPase [Nitrospirota bacterium]